MSVRARWLAWAMVGLSACGDSSTADAGDADAGPTRATFPERPTSADGADGEELRFALMDPVFDQQEGDAWETIGYDLDGFCTEIPDLDVACLPPSRGGDVSDGVGCRDNMGGHQLFFAFEMLVGSYGAVMVDALRSGIGAPLLFVQGWSGARDDTLVEAGLAFATHGTSAAGTAPTSVEIAMGVPVADGAPVAAPRLDGSDDFFADETSWDVGQSRPLAWDDAAYVADGQLVMRLPDRVAFTIGDDDLTSTFRLTDARLVVEVGTGVPETAVLTGRWSALDLLESGLRQGAFVCPGTMGYGLLEALADIVPDIRSAPGTGGSADVVCDAVSLAIPFTRAARVNVPGTARLDRAAPCP